MKNKGFPYSDPQKRNIYAEFIYTDSNLWLDIFNEERRGHATSTNFLRDIYSSDNSLLVYSDHTLVEIKKVLRENVAYANFPQKQSFKNLNYSEQKTVSDIVDIEYEKLLKIFKPVSEQLSYDPLNIMDTTIRVAKAFEHKVHEEDTRHLAVMKENGINSIATSDKGLFNNTKGLNVYGDNKSITHHQNTFSNNSLNEFDKFNTFVDKF